MAPEWARLPLVFIATAATIIASQAVISGAFSVTHQAIQLGFLLRLRTLHTSERAAGQIYIPAINWGLLFTVLTTWAKGRQLMQRGMDDIAMPLAVFIQSASSAHRVHNTAVFMSAAQEGVPAALLHNFKHNQVLHERVLILTVQVEEIPYVEPGERRTQHDLGHGFHRVMLRYGFMDDVDVPRDLTGLQCPGGPFDMMKTSFFLGRQKLVASASKPGMALWREHLFAWMSRSSESAMEFFRIPTNRVVELGSQVQI
jgi:KUP system potassium uptake protein